MFKALCFARVANLHGLIKLWMLISVAVGLQPTDYDFQCIVLRAGGKPARTESAGKLWMLISVAVGLQPTALQGDYDFQGIVLRAGCKPARTEKVVEADISCCGFATHSLEGLLMFKTLCCARVANPHGLISAVRLIERLD